MPRHIQYPVFPTPAPNPELDQLCAQADKALVTWQMQYGVQLLRPTAAFVALVKA